MSTRRTFLKLAAATATALDITRYAEPLQKIASKGEWVEDRGDFYVVRVPDFKTFARETLDKPTIFLLGERATVADVMVAAHCNIHAPKGGRVVGSYFDTRMVEMEKSRPVMLLAGRGMLIQGCVFDRSERDEYAILAPRGVHDLTIESVNLRTPNYGNPIGMHRLHLKA